jgi:CRISPR system Cascade subunit CasA
MAPEVSFNLLAEPWIPIRDIAGASRDVGVREALLDAHNIGDVQCESPLSTVGVLRVLLAILYRACGPPGTDGWAELWESRRFPERHISAYLERWGDRFDLYSLTHPFMQIPDFNMTKAGSVAQLAAEAASGNNPTLFDHTLDDAPPVWTAAEAARWLLASQSFALGFGKAGGATVCGSEMPRPYFADAICLRGVTLWLAGDSLFETLTLNLVPVSRAGSGAPAWERDSALATLDEVKGKERITLPAEGPADRYAWLSRMIRLMPEPDGAVSRAYFTQGREADKRRGDPMKAFAQGKEEGEYALGLSAGRASWRDLASYLAFGELRCPIVDHAGSQVYADVLPRTKTFRLNVVGLATESGKAGKFLLWRHDRVSLPSGILEDRNAVEQLRIALGDAEFVGRELNHRVRDVVKRFLPPEGNPDPDDVDRLSAAIDPRPAYWARLEPHFSRLVFDLPVRASSAVETWRGQVEAEARKAFREAAYRLGTTGRALRAVARIYTVFVANEAEVAAQRAAAKERKAAKGKGGKKE